MRTRLLSLFLVLVGCSEPTQNPQTPSSGTNAGETAHAPTAPPSAPDDLPSTPRDAADPCAELRAEANAILRAPALACSNDEDCACYPAIIDCGGVRDDSTAQRLIELSERRSAMDCGYRDMEGNQFNCAPRRCVPRCSAGACGRDMK